MKTVLELDGVDASFGGPKVLKQVRLRVHAGERWALLGPNGAGKSSLVRVAMGLLVPSAGDVRVVGESVRGMSREHLARQLAWVPQSPAETLGFTALEVVLMGLSSRLGPWGSASADDVARARTLLQELGIAGLGARSVDGLSGGERRLVWLARALLQRPPLLLLDEPTAFLDVRHQVEGLKRVQRAVVAQECQAAVAVLHDINLASWFATHVALIKEGCVLSQGPVAEVLDERALSELYGVSVVKGGQSLFAVSGG